MGKRRKLDWDGGRASTNKDRDNINSASNSFNVATNEGKKMDIQKKK